MTARCIIVSFMLTLMGCAGPAPVFHGDGAPSEPVDLSGVPDAVPKVEPLSPLGNDSPYIVLGRTYHVLPTAVGYQATGVASWYGTKFHGRLTSSGQPYDMFQMTAAHRSLPIPSYVEVKNLKNGRSAVVKVNDRGPFREDRIIDLSYAAAVRLGFVNEGVARVRLAAIDPGEEKPLRRGSGQALRQGSGQALRQGSGQGAARAPREGRGQALRQASRQASGQVPRQASGQAARQSFGQQPMGAKRLFLQAGAFSTAEAAAEFSGALRSIVGDRVRIVRFPGQDDLHRVRVGPLGDLGEASRLQALIITADLGVPLIIHD